MRYLTTRWLDSREDDTGDVLVRQLVVLELLGAKEPVAQSSSGGNGDRCQQGLSSHVSDGIDVWLARVLVVVHDDIARLLIQLDTGFVSAQLLRVGVSANGPKQDIGLDGLVQGVDGDAESAIVELLDLLDVGLFVHVHSGFFYSVGQWLKQPRRLLTHPCKGSKCPATRGRTFSRPCRA